MKVTRTRIPGVVVVDLVRHEDSRGTFSRLFCANELGLLVAPKHLVQINHSRSTTRGTVRGLHYQLPPHTETKFVQCLRGRVWDVAVDLREGSPTFLEWHAEDLAPANGRMMIVPDGCAHGFQTLEPDTELLYFHTEFYNPESERGVSPIDPRIGIPWPLPIESMSEKDAAYPLLAPDFRGIAIGRLQRQPD